MNTGTKPTYPQRPRFFAHRFVRVLHKSCAAQDIGPAACYLCCIIAHTEDAGRYAGPARFWRSQLMETLGFKSPKQLVIARNKAIEAGWLVYHQAGTRAVGEYFVAIPSRFDSLPDSAIEPAEDEEISSASGTNPKCQPAALVPPGPHKRNANGSISGTQSGPLPIPIPIPCPHTASAAPKSPSGDAPSLAQIIERWNAIPGVVHCKAATKKRVAAYRSRIHDAGWLESLDTALAAIAASAFLRGEGERGWRADIDWFLRPDTLTKVLEGKYGNGAAAQESIYRELRPRRRADHAAAGNGRPA